MGMIRFAAFGAALGLLAGCATPDPLDSTRADLGDFRLKWTIVVAENAQVIPPSRNATPDEWKDILIEEIDRRFGRYDGTRDYHIAVNIDGYAIAVPGIPIVLAPKSVLVLSANVWDHDEARRLNIDPEQLTVFEGASADTVIGSGLTKSKEQQMRTLARNAAAKIETWLLENPDWFNRTPLPATTDDTDANG